MKRCYALVAMLLACACAPVQRPATPASVALPDRFALLDADARALVAPEALLPETDPAFIALRDRAMADAPDLAVALARIDVARAGVRGAGAAQLPLVSASAGVSRQQLTNSAYGGVLPSGTAARTGYSTGIDASWDLDLFGRLRANARAARARLDAATSDAAAVRLALASDIAAAVIENRTLSERLIIVSTDRASAHDLVALIQTRSKAGLAPGFDLVRAQSLEAEAEARREPILAQQAVVLARLATLTAQSVETVREAFAVSVAPVLVDGGALAVPTLLLRSRPDVAAAEQRLRAADAEIAAAAAERYPRLSLSGTLGLTALAAGDIFDSQALIGAAGASIAGPLIDFGRISARIREKEAGGREAFARYRAALFVALGDVEAILGSVRAVDNRAAIVRGQVRLDQDATKLARERYRRGLESFLTVIDAERTLNRSREAEVLARGDAMRQRVLLYRAIGGPGVAF